MTTFETLSLIVSAAAVASIWSGIWQICRVGDQRAAREDARHAESMEALQALIRGMETVIERTGAAHRVPLTVSP